MFSVTNTNNFEFTARFNGKDYTFPKNETVAMNVDAATHIFGIGADDKTVVFLRHGWFGPPPGQDRARAADILKKFKFDSIDSVPDGAIVTKGRVARAEGDGVSGGSLSQDAPVPSRTKALE